MGWLNHIRKKRLLQELSKEEKIPDELRRKLPDLGVPELQGLVATYKTINVGVQEHKKQAGEIWDRVRSRLPPSASGVSFNTNVLINAIAMQLFVGKSATEIETEVLSVVTGQLRAREAKPSEYLSTFRSGFADAPAKSSSAGRM